MALYTKQTEAEAPRDDDLEKELLLAIFITWYATMAKAVHRVVLTVLGMPFAPLEPSALKQAVLAAQAEAAVVDATTRRLIVDRIIQGIDRGLTANEIAYGTDEFAGIDGLFDVTWKNRPLTVARTVLQKATLSASIERYRTLGKGKVDRLLIHDGDYDEFCAGRDGTTVPISQEPSMAHPNCRLMVTPIFVGE